MAKHPTEPKGNWPSIEEQLAEAKAIPGSAFEKFIRLNQDFELLREGETPSDTIGLAPWLPRLSLLLRRRRGPGLRINFASGCRRPIHFWGSGLATPPQGTGPGRRVGHRGHAVELLAPDCPAPRVMSCL